MKRTDRSLLVVAIFGTIAISFGAGLWFSSLGSDSNVTECVTAECLQLRPILAAEAAARWAWWQVFIAGAGVVGLIVTLGLNRRALSQTERSFEIAKDSNRAWVVCDKIELTKNVEFMHNSAFGERYMISASVKLKNFGGGFAKSIRIKLDIVSMQTVEFEPRWHGHPQAADKHFALHTMPWPMGVALAPNAEISLPHGFGGPADGHPSLQQVRWGAFFFIGYIQYLDHFDRPHHTRFVFHPDGDSVRPWDFRTIVPAGAYAEAS